MRSYSIDRMMKYLNNCSLMIEGEREEKMNIEDPGILLSYESFRLFLIRYKPGNLSLKPFE
jgi:hypothetical protein